MNQWREEMKARTHEFSVAVILLLHTIPDRSETRRVKDQLADAASGLDLNWRAACRARTHKEFTARLGTVLEEADEAEGWRVSGISCVGHSMRSVYAPQTETRAA